VALITLLAGTVDQLISFNLTRSQDVIFNGLLDIEIRQEAVYPSRLQLNQVPLNDTSALNKSSLATPDVIDRLYFALSGNDSDRRVARLAEFELEVFGITLQQFDLYPTPDDPLYWQFALALNQTDPDPNVINATQVFQVLSDFTRSSLDSTTWFPAAAGMTFILLGALRYIRQTPRDKWELGGILTLVIGGLVYIPLCIMDIGSRRQIDTISLSDYSTHIGAAIWNFAASGWVLPSFAILSLFVMLGDAGCDFMARRSLQKQIGSDDPQVYAPMFGEKDCPQDPVNPMNGASKTRPSTSVDTIPQMTTSESKVA